MCKMIHKVHLKRLLHSVISNSCDLQCNISWRNLMIIINEHSQGFIQILHVAELQEFNTIFPHNGQFQVKSKPSTCNTHRHISYQIKQTEEMANRQLHAMRTCGNNLWSCKLPASSQSVSWTRSSQIQSPPKTPTKITLDFAAHRVIM
jgi:hypothetical protein